MGCGLSVLTIREYRTEIRTTLTLFEGHALQKRISSACAEFRPIVYTKLTKARIIDMVAFDTIIYSTMDEMLKAFMQKKGCRS